MRIIFNEIAVYGSLTGNLHLKSYVLVLIFYFANEPYCLRKYPISRNRKVPAHIYFKKKVSENLKIFFFFFFCVW